MRLAATHRDGGGRRGDCARADRELRGAPAASAGGNPAALIFERGGVGVGGEGGRVVREGGWGRVVREGEGRVGGEGGWGRVCGEGG